MDVTSPPFIGVSVVDLNDRGLTGDAHQLESHLEDNDRADF